jgi:ubiquinone/menaquinone biosynthesis C-methylase UbiE
MRTIVEPRMGEKVLDLGNGGVREFFSERTSLYIGVDFSLEMLKKGGDTSIQKICGEATALPFKKEVFDTIFHRSLLHHLAEKDMEMTMKRVKTVLRYESACLKKEGNVIIIEPCFPTFLERIEEFLYRFLRAFFFLTKQSNVFLFSEGTLTKMLLENGYQEIKIWKGDDHGKKSWEFISLMIGLPFLKIPRWLNPVRRVILEGKERS